MRVAFPGLSAALAEGMSVVLPTPILASVANEQYRREQLQGGRSSWERPKILAIDAWMQACWQQLRFSLKGVPLLLSPAQELELWRETIDRRRSDLFDVRAMASLARRAARLVAEYDISCDREGWLEYPDAREFLNWHAEVQRRLQAEKWITRSDLWRLLPKWIGQGGVELEPVVFGALGGGSTGLMNLSQALGAQVRPVAVTCQKHNGPLRTHVFQVPEVQFDHAARVIRHLLEAGSAKSIGVFVVDLPNHARELTRRMNEVFFPASRGEESNLFHMQAGSSLEAPVISNFLLLLELLRERIGYASAGAILRSPFLTEAETERARRAAAWERLQRARELDFSFSEVARAARDCPAMLRLLNSVKEIRTTIRPSMRMDEWSATFGGLLSALVLPNIPAPSRQEQRAIDLMDSALSEMTALGLISGPTSLDMAVSHLRSALSRPMEAGDWSSPVQILSAGQAEGIEFDHSFVLNASAEAWPEPAPLLPLVPYALQRMAGVPGSSAEGSLELRQRMSDALLRSSRQVRICCSGKPSPLLGISQGSNDSEPRWSGKTAWQLHSAADLEALDDGQAPPLPPGNVTGGASVIKAQSQCPFRAFAEYRLRARREDEASFGFDALERGTFLHRALENVWRELQTQANLKSVGEQDLRMLVEDCVLKAVQDDGSGPIRTLITAAERERIKAVVLDWLRIDRERLEPFAVEFVEKKQDAELAGLHLQLRVDRIDRLKDGSVLLIDYKSGQQSKEKLVQGRPKEPQLLVYAASVGEPVTGLVLAELKNRAARAVGHTARRHFQNAGGVKTHQRDWDVFLSDAATKVHQIAEEFVSGFAPVRPEGGACAYCHISPICRIHEAGPALEDEE